MAKRRKGRVFSLRLTPPANRNLMLSEGDLVVEALSPGKRVTRYGREWIVGGTVLDEGVLRGRIGFRGAEGMAEVWDENKKDFEEVAVPAGLTAPFAIDLESLRMVVQPRNQIKLEGMLGAFVELLSGNGFRWTIESPRESVSFAKWLTKVDKVTLVHFRVRKPNPHYYGTPDLERLVEEAEAQAADFELRSEKGLNVDSEFVAEAQRHVERDYGEARYEGVTKDGKNSTVYNSVLGAEEQFAELDAGPDGEVELLALVRALDVGAGKGDTGGRGGRGRSQA